MSVNFEETSPTVAANLKLLSILFWTSEQLRRFSVLQLTCFQSDPVDAWTREKRDIPLKQVETCR